MDGPDSAEDQRSAWAPLERRELAGNRPIFDFLRQIARNGAVAVAVLGPPGSGKTTLLQHVALTLARNRQRPHGLRAYVPLFLFLRDHVKQIAVAEPPTLADLVQGHMAKRSHLAPPPRWFEGQLLAGKCMVLLDGLDEVADKALRERVASWVDTQIKAYPRSPFVLSARPQGYREAPLERAHVLEIQPFGAEQAKAFVRSWYLANEIMASNGERGEGVRQRAATQAEDLLERLRQRPALGDLTRNPLLLTMITTVHSTRNALPGRQNNVANIKALTRPLLRSSSRGLAHAGTLLLDLITLLRASTPAARRRAWCSYGAHLTACASIGPEQMNEDPTDDGRDAMLDLHWFFQVQLARMMGTLPAWEGIRFVRERSA
jgi:hypothetical protein